MSRQIKINNITIGGHKPLILIAGPCVIEEEGQTINLAKELRKICKETGLGLIFKCSYDKANRSSLDSYRGPGFKKGLEILKKIKKQLSLPLLVDIHQIGEVNLIAEVADILQIPAFLCRQTDLILVAAKTKRIINVKKGQFLAPWDVENIVKKIESTGNKKILLTERGTCFGYNNLVSDMRSLVIMRKTGYPVVFDATHSVQLPGGKGETSSGQREFVPYLAQAATAVGIDGLFMEVHFNPDQALSDGPNMIKINQLKPLLEKVKAIDRIVKKGTLKKTYFRNEFNE